MASKKPCSLVVVHANGKRLVGTAAQLAHISEKGGWDSFIEQIAEEVATSVIANFTAAYNARARQPSLAVAGGRDVIQNPEGK